MAIVYLAGQSLSCAGFCFTLCRDRFLVSGACIQGVCVHMVEMTPGFASLSLSL